MNRRYVAFYIRLSDADEEVRTGEKEESNSIMGQRELLYRYIDQSAEYKNAEVFEYFDDGYSGTGFAKRESLQNMLKDAGAGRFECILVKDFSRLGRDYIEVGNFMEFVFPTMGIRFISVNDGYDSARSTGMTGGMDVAFKNLIYQLYSRDLSRKVKSARRNRNLNGEYTASFTAYGYIKDKNDKHKLVIDESVAPYVREVFRRIIDGDAAIDIVRDFNSRGVPTRVSKQKSRCNYRNRWDSVDDLWDISNIYSMVHNEIYAGKLIQNRMEMVGFGDDKRLVKTSRDKWCIVEGVVPAIVSEEDFKKAADVLAKRRKSDGYTGRNRQGLNLFTCAYCGRKLVRAKWQSWFACKMGEQGGDERCKDAQIRIKKAEKLVLDVTKEHCEMLLEEEKIRKSEALSRKKADANNADAQKSKRGASNLRTEPEIRGEIDNLEKSVVELYKRYSMGDVSKESYIEERKRTKELIAELEEEIKSLCNKVEDPFDSIQPALEHIPLIGNESDAGILSQIIEKVLVYSEDRLEVVFKGNDVVQVRSNSMRET